MPEVASAYFPMAPRPPCDARLLAAIQGDDTAAIRQLVDATVTPNCSDEGGPTALSLAILADRVAVVRALLESGADPDLRWQRGDRLPLQDVIEGGALFGMRNRHRAEMLGLLIRRGVDVNARWCPFESRLPLYREDGGARTLVMPGCTAVGGVTALWMAARLGQGDAVAQLLTAGAEPGWLDGQSAAPLIALDVAPTEDIFGMLMVRQFGSESAAVADYRRRDPRVAARAVPGQPRLLEAISNRYYGLARLMLAAGANPDEAATDTGGGMTPLQLAVALRWEGGVELLLDAGAALEGRSCPSSLWFRAWDATVDMTGCTPARGLTPLMVAAATRTPIGVFGRDRSFTLLDSTAVDWQGRSARRHAELAGVPARTLFNYGVDSKSRPRR